jgi:hypothetical protein
VSLEIIAHVRRHPGAQLHGEHERRQDVRLVAYYRVASLADSLRGAARRDAYHGYLTPCCHYWKPEGAVHGRDDAVRRVVGRGGVDRGDAGAPGRPGGPRLREKTGVGDGLMAPGCAPCPSERRVGLPRIRRPWERMRSAQLHVPSSPSFPATSERTARLHFRSAQVRPSKTRTCFASESSAAISPRHSCTPPLSYPWMIQPKTIEAKKTG